MGINFSKFIENRIENIRASDSLAFALAIGTGSWIAPIAPAVVFGYSLWKSAPEDMGEFRIITAVAVAVCLIVAGAVSSHNAIMSKSKKPWLLVAAYILLEIAGLWLMSVSFEVKVVGTVASLLTLVVYLSRTNANEIDIEKKDERLEVEKSREREQDRLDFQMEQDRLNAEHVREQERLISDQKHAESLAKIEAKSVSLGTFQGAVQNVPKASQDNSIEAVRGSIIAELGKERPNLTELASRLGLGRTTLYRRIGTLVGTGEIIKNGSGYELPSKEASDANAPTSS